MENDLVIRKYLDYLEEINGKVEKNTIDDFVAGLWYDILDECDTVAEAEEISDEIERALIEHYKIGN